MNKIKVFLSKTFISLRWFILGIGLGGLNQYDDFFLDILFLILTVTGLCLAFTPERYYPEEKWPWG